MIIVIFIFLFFIFVICLYPTRLFVYMQFSLTQSEYQWFPLSVETNFRSSNMRILRSFSVWLSFFSLLASPSNHWKPFKVFFCIKNVSSSLTHTIDCLSILLTIIHNYKLPYFWTNRYPKSLTIYLFCFL